MKSKAKSVNVFEVRLWSKKHYGTKLTKSENIFQGCLTEQKTGRSIWFRSVGKMLNAIEELYGKAEKHTKVKYLPCKRFTR